MAGGIARELVPDREETIKAGEARANQDALRVRINGLPARSGLQEIRADLAHKPGLRTTDTAIATDATIKVVPVGHHERERQG